MGRFIQPDTLVPEPGNPQALNRYSYCLNNPVKYSDPSGHDVMLVGGWNSEDWEDPLNWQAWIMAYKGWGEAEWEKFYTKWASADIGDVGKQALMEETGVHIFNWTACNCADDGDSRSSSRKATVGWALGALEEQMQGMQDITLVGHSKGGNLVYNYISAGGHQQAVKNAVIIAAPTYQWGILSLVYGLRPGPPWLNESARQSNVVSLAHVYDPATLGLFGQLVGATNHVDFSPTSKPHSFHRRDSVAQRTLTVDLSIVGDRYAHTK